MHDNATRAAIPSASPPVRVVSRIDGIDFARAIAFAGMLLAHYVGPLRAGEPGWIEAIDNASDGRAAPLFCVLLGVGSGLLLARGTPDRVLVQRGIVLFVLGLAIWPYVQHVFLILPHYGLLLVSIPLLRRLPTRWLLPVAALAFVVPSAITGIVDGHGLRAGGQPETHGALLEVRHLAGNLFWSGGYPLVGWIGFALVGLWVARHHVRDRATQVRLLIGGGVIACAQPVLALAFRALDGHTDDPDARGWSAFFDGSAHSNQTAWYIVASATAVAVIGACLLVAPRVRSVLRPVFALGAMALSAYLAHLAIGARFVWDWRDRTVPSLGSQLLLAAFVFGVLAIGAAFWSTRFRRGPVESVLRAISR
jgi:uncharacterized membrane protein YeiB